MLLLLLLLLLLAAGCTMLLKDDYYCCCCLTAASCWLPTAADWLVLPLTMCCRLLLLQAPSPAGVLVLLLQL